MILESLFNVSCQQFEIFVLVIVSGNFYEFGKRDAGNFLLQVRAGADDIVNLLDKEAWNSQICHKLSKIKIFFTETGYRRANANYALRSDYPFAASRQTDHDAE